MDQIILITFESGMMVYIPKDDKALDYIEAHFDFISDIQFIKFGGDL